MSPEKRIRKNKLQRHLEAETGSGSYALRQKKYILIARKYVKMLKYECAKNSDPNREKG